MIAFSSTLGTAWASLNRPGDASNGELQCYTPANAALAGGSLHIVTASDTSCSGYNYTSGMLQWKSFNFTYGTVSVRARLAGGKGTWPAIWMLGANCQTTNITDPNNIPPCNWPQPGSDEIDIAEVLGGDRSAVNQQIHSSAGNPACGARASDTSQNWHIYTLVWSAGSAGFKIDGTTTCSLTTAVPSRPMFLLINTAAGGVGGTVDPATLQQVSSIDYVRVTQP